jgi:nitroreductase
MELMEAIKARRSIRKYKPDPVPEQTLRTVLEAVQWTPSWANTQCWEIILVTDPKIKSELATTLPKGNPAIPSMTDAPMIIVLCGKKGTSGYYKDQVTTDKGDWLMFDTGLAMQSLCLAAHALGLGTVVIGMMDHRKASQILGVPGDIEVVAMTPLGYPATAGGSSKRKEIAEFVSYEKFGSRKR